MRSGRHRDDAIPTVHILVATQPVNFRKGHDGLAALLQSVLKEDPFTGIVFPLAPTKLV